MENLHIGKGIPFDYIFNLSFVHIDFIRLTADGRIKLTISFTDEQTGRVVSASAQEHLSPWL